MLVSDCVNALIAFKSGCEAVAALGLTKAVMSWAS